MHRRCRTEKIFMKVVCFKSRSVSPHCLSFAKKTCEIFTEIEMAGETKRISSHYTTLIRSLRRLSKLPEKKRKRS